MLTSLRSTLKSTPGIGRLLASDGWESQGSQKRVGRFRTGSLVHVCSLRDHRFVGFGRRVAQGGMSTSGVVVSDVVGDLLSCHVFVGVRLHFEFGLDGAKARLHEGV